ncbi:MAG: arginine--tRNA ligase [bacterium]
MKKLLITYIKKSIETLWPEVLCPEISLTPPQKEEFGEYATPVALQLGKIIGENPRTVAEKIVASIAEHQCISNCTVAGPGFINFKLTDEAVLNNLSTILSQKELFEKRSHDKPQTIIVEYSHPNVAKPLSIGHLRSTIIGESLKRIFIHLGYNVIADNYLGDWGTQFGKLIYAYKSWGNEATVKKDPIHEFLQLYVDFHTKAETDPTLEDNAREEFKKLENGDTENLALWNWVVKESKKELHKLYERLETSFTFIHGESFYQNMLEEIIQEALKKGIAVQNEDNSVAVLNDHPTLPSTLIQRSDGATLYLTRDLAADKYYEEQFHPLKVLHVVSNEQALYFKQLAAVRKQIGSTHEILHINFGLMRLPEGKMSTRKGRVIFLEQVLEDAVTRAYEMVKDREGLTEEEKKSIAKTIGIGAVKYNDLSQNRKTDIVFDWEKVLNLHGNSGPYLQYTYARILSVITKATESTEIPGQKLELTESEKSLLRKFLYFGEAIEEAAKEYSPNILSTYLYELASLFNTFYQQVPILKAEKTQQKFRLALSQATAELLKTGLNLLGINVVNKM